MIGETLRHYRIEAKLGAGGMGVVYRALDTHLNRPVAIKVLPAAALSNPDRRARFAQEARSASALSHRNIITIYDIDSAQMDGESADFIAMEFVAGKTLDKLIGRKGIRLHEALRYAVQIADGLAAAHAAGIIHRDLKPANVIANEQGEVKILDFGLAKLTEPEPEPPDVHAPTESVHIDQALETEAGTIVGTVAYMSPEQADGHKVDERSDIFSFGAMLYEMISGRRAFPGDSKLSTLASVLHKEPVPLSQLGESVPREVERIIMRCLRKDPQRRWQSMADLKVALEDVRDELESGAETPEKSAGERPQLRGLPLFFWLALSVLVAAGGVYIGSQVLTSTQPKFQRLTYRRGDVLAAKFSPDGQTVVFSAQWGSEPVTIFSMRPGSRESRPLDLPEARILSISSSGEMAILLGANTPGTLARVPLSGGAPREILENVNDADWSPDGTNLAVSHTVGSRNRIEYPIGTVLYESEGRPPLRIRVSKKGDLIALFEYNIEAGDYAVDVVDLHGKKRILSRGWGAVGNLEWSPKGDEIWFGGKRLSGGDPALYAVKLNGAERTVVQMPAWILIEDIAPDGRVLMDVTDGRVGIIGLPPGAKQERELSWFDASSVYDISSDGKTILFIELSYGHPRNPAIYLRKTDGAPAVRLGDGHRPALSPDGKWVACIVTDGPKTKLTLLPTGAGESRTIGPEGMHYERVEWFPDGQRILFAGNEPNRPVRTFQQDLSGGKPVAVTPEGMIAARVSPDQKSVTVVGGGKLSLYPIAGGDPKLIGNLDPGESVIRWSGDGRFLFLRQLTSPSTLKISRLDVATGRKEVWRELKTPDPVGVTITQVALTPDGNSYAYSFQRDIATLYLADGLR